MFIIIDGYLFVFRQVLTDLQQKVNKLQFLTANSPPSSGDQVATDSNIDSSVLSEVRDNIRQIKSETNSLLQKTVKQNQLIRL